MQGLADAFHIMHYPFDSAQARQLNKEIFETIYYAALKASHALAVRDGHYETFPGSPASQVRVVIHPLMGLFVCVHCYY